MRIRIVENKPGKFIVERFKLGKFIVERFKLGKFGLFPDKWEAALYNHGYGHWWPATFDSAKKAKQAWLSYQKYKNFKTKVIEELE